jgi:hypothetical protein
MRFVQDNITGFIGGHQPATAMLPGKLDRRLGQKARRHHVRVESRSSLFIGQTGLLGLGGEFFLDFESNRVAWSVS